MILLYSYWGEYFGYKFSLPQEAMLSLPQWSEREAFPPLPPRLAIANAKAVVQDLLEEVRPFNPGFHACSLQRRSEYEGGSWYYVVSWFVPDLEDSAVDWSEFSVPVLFDGSTPKPVKFKYDERLDVYRSSD